MTAFISVADTTFTELELIFAPRPESLTKETPVPDWKFTPVPVMVTDTVCPTSEESGKTEEIVCPNVKRNGKVRNKIKGKIRLFITRWFSQTKGF